MAATRATIDGILCDREAVHVNTIRQGDTVEINGHLKTVCGKDIKTGGFMGATLFGDSYRSGTAPVIKATPVHVMPNLRAQQMGMFEVIAAGFNGGDDKTDDRVIWVRAPDQAALEAMIKPYGATCTPVEISAKHADWEIGTEENKAFEVAFLQLLKDFQASA